MEQKKTLWILAATGVFLLVVFGLAKILYNPSTINTAKTASINPVEKKAQSGWTNQDNTDLAANNAETSSPQVNDMFVVSENTTVLGFNQTTGSAFEDNSQPTTIDLNSLKKELSSDLALAQPQNINITVNVSDTEPQAQVTEPPVVVTSAYYKEDAKSAEAAEKATSVKKTTSTKVAEAPKSTPKAVSTEKSATPAATKTTTTAASSPVTRFWVQVAAYSNKKTAENARTILSDKKINSDIYTYEDNKSKLFYRVRVGPFTTKSEAEYWQSKIVEISDFAKAGSYVTSTVN